MILADIIDAQSVLANLKAQSKKQLLQELSQAMAKTTGIDHKMIFETLSTREKLGSTGLGQGIAVPHGKIAALGRVHGLFARLAAPVGFGAVDGPPGAHHPKARPRISRLMRDPAIVAKLRGTDTAEGLYAILTEPSTTASAA